jgi:class 3 adenylate cyclase/tetratricopeptide (TPR) repeat protein
MTGQKTTLDMFIPEDRRQALSRGETLPGRTYGAVLFADVSGFTQLTGILSTELGPQRGAEELIRQLDPIYTSLVNAIHSFRGSVIVISGDGITCWFDQDDGRRSIACAFVMQNIMDQHATITLPTGQKIGLGIKIALSVGLVHRFLVGDPNIQLLEALGGSELDQVVSVHQSLEKGEIAISAKLLKKIEEEVIVLSWRQTSDGRQFAIIDEKAGLAEANPWPQIPDLDDEVARKWVFASIYNRIKDEEIGFLTELRQVVPMFLNFTGLDYDQDEKAGEKLDQFIRCVQSILARYEGYLCQLTIGDKGSNIFIAFGAPIAQEDNINSALTAALKLKEEIGRLDFVPPIQIGMTHGQLWAGPHGGSAARTYSIMGSEVNLASRLMSHAKPGQILVSPHVAESAPNYSFEQLSPLNFKGIEKPMAPLVLLGKARAQNEPLQWNRILGRERERGLLSQTLKELVAGGESAPARIILIEGEAGIGKSHLLSDLIEKANQMGVKVLRGEGEPVERTTQYYGIRPVFESIFGFSETDELSVIQKRVTAAIAGSIFLTDRAPLLSEVIPVRWPDNHLTEQMSGEARATSTRELLLEILRISLVKDSQYYPTAIILDDAQWLDTATWALVGYIYRELPGILIAIAMRPIQEGEIGVQNKEEYRRLRAHPGTQYIQLNSLFPDETTELISQKLGIKTVPDSILDFILARAQGNPFFSEEVAYALRDAGIIRIKNGEAVIDLVAEELNRIDFPQTIQGVITSRIDQLSPAHQLTLKVASVIGRVFLLNMLSNVHPAKLNMSTLTEYLTSLTRLGITELEAPTPDLTYLFKHVMTQEVVYNLLTYAQRKQLHCAVAEWSEVKYQENISPYYSRLAHHWLKGEAIEKAIYYLDKAGEQALELYSNEDVIRFISIAIELEQKKSESTMKAEISFHGKLQRARWERMLGMAHFRLGHLPEAQTHLLQTLELLGRPMPDSNFWLTVSLIKELFQQISYRLFPSRLGKLLTNEQRALEEELARVEIESVFYYSQNNSLLAWGILRRLNLAERLGIPALMAEGYSNLQLIVGLANLQGPYRSYRKLKNDALEKADRTSVRIFALLREGVVHFTRCNWDEAHDNLKTGIKLAEQLGDNRQWAELTATLATSLYLEGQFEKALLVWKDQYQKFSKSESLQSLAWGLYGQGHNLLMLGQGDEAIRLIEASIAIPMKNADDKILNTSRYGALSLAYFRKGDFDKALENVLHHQRLAPPTPPVSSTVSEYEAVFEAITGLWENINLGIYAPGSTNLTRLEQTFHRIPHIAKSIRRTPANKAKTYLYEGIYYEMTGNLRHALASWRKCIELAEHYHQPYELGRAHYEIGLYSNNTDLTEHLKMACETFENIGTPYELVLARTALERSTNA